MRIPVLMAMMAGMLSYSGFGQNMPTTLPDEYSRLSDPKHEVRYQAMVDVMQVRAKTAAALLNSLEELAKTPDRNSYSPLHITIRIIADQKIRQAVPMLVQLMDYQLDPKTVNPFGFAANESYYPAALALATLGDKSVVDAVLERISDKSTNEITSRLGVWVLQKCLGRDLSLSAVRSRLQTNRESAGLKLAAELLAQEYGYPSPPMPK